MTQMRVEIEGGVDEVVRVLRQLGNAGRHATAGGAGGSMETPAPPAVMMRRRPPVRNARRYPMKRLPENGRRPWLANSWLVWNRRPGG